jgi:hypothetical protein
MPDAEKDVAFTVPSAEWLAQALCGWHDAESGRLEGESFPCAYCTMQAEYVAEHARVLSPEGSDA